MGIEFFVSFETMRGFQRASSYRQEKTLSYNEVWSINFVRKEIQMDYKSLAHNMEL